jgi:hypothetical protein
MFNSTSAFSKQDEREETMKKSRICGGVLAAVLVVGISSAASAQNMSKEANLQAMRWYAQQQMAKGLPNPYPGVNLWTGQGFSEFRRGLTNPYLSNYGYGYGNSYYGNTYVNPYVNPYSNTNTYVNPYYGYGGSYWY